MSTKPETTLDEIMEFLRDHMVMREELELFALKEDLEQFATKADLERFATKEDLAMVRAEMATKADLERFATKDDLAAVRAEMVTKDDLASGLAAMEGRIADHIHQFADRLMSDIAVNTARVERLERRTGILSA